MLPAVLTREEVAKLLSLMTGEHRLFAQLLYGAGMRITEGLQLRVKDVEVDRGAIIVREGKGGKDRAVMLPQSLLPPLKNQLAKAHLQNGDAPYVAPFIRHAFVAGRV